MDTNIVKMAKGIESINRGYQYIIVVLSKGGNASGCKRET